MRKDSLLATLAPVAGAFALFLRWLQNTIILEPETGLASSGSGVSWALVLLCLLFAALAWLLSFRLRSRLQSAPALTAFYGSTPFRVSFAAMGGLASLGALLTLLQRHPENKILWLIFSILALFAGISMLLLPFVSENNRALRCFFSAVPVIFYCFWLVFTYKENASNPVLWSFAPTMLGISLNAAAWYYLAGFAFGEPKPAGLLFSGQLAVFWGLLLMGNTQPLSLRLITLCPALTLFVVTLSLLRSSREA